MLADDVGCGDLLLRGPGVVGLRAISEGVNLELEVVGAATDRQLLLVVLQVLLAERARRLPLSHFVRVEALGHVEGP